MVKNLVSKLSSSSSLTSSTSSQHEVHNPKNRNDPGRFFGDGVQFKAKLIGILEVGEARGDRMCQEALQDLKMAIRAAGEHKQRITIHVTIDGLRLRDEKTSDSLYHHPVHKISFIAQDMTDSRAFGYIFGSPDSGHRFFGIKTDKAASQVVLAMRDLFQVVFELKKKEIELARQQIQSKTIHEHQPLTLSVKNASVSDAASILSGSSGNKINNTDSVKSSHIKEMSPESVADLVDLEQELSSIQRGITQMERITPNEPTPTGKSLTDEDPFGDSFTNFPTYNLLPPPESTRSRHSKPSKPPDSTISSTNNTSSVQCIPNIISSQSAKPNQINTTDNWLDDLDQQDVFETTKSVTSLSVSNTTPVPIPSTAITSTSTTSTTPAVPMPSSTQNTPPSSTVNNITSSPSAAAASTSLGASSSAITQQNDDSQKSDLDPLGTGRIRPYVDKKYFFQELKNPPKKVLKDLSGSETSFTAQFVSGGSDGNSDVSSIETPLQATAGNGDAKAQPTSDDKQPSNGLPTDPVMLPRDTDPFSPTRKKSDPFQDGDIFGKLDPFEFEFPTTSNTSGLLSETKVTSIDGQHMSKKDNVFNGPLQVNLPPESGWSATNTNQMQQQNRRMERQTSESPTATNRNRPSVFKQNTVDVISSISSKKMPHLFGQKFSKRDSNSINMRRLQESDSLSENEAAPEPPPRPDSVSHAEPPPLPPKKQFSDIVIRPRITPPPSSNRYESVTSSKIRSNPQDTSVPPIPLPSRRIGRSEGTYPGPGRPRKPGNDDDDYLQPITGGVPPLLPPPQTRGRLRRQEIYENKTEAIGEHMEPIDTVRTDDNDIEETSILPDITLSQLLTLGIDELAAKLSVPTSKLSTMTLVELTTYLSEFIEKSKKPKQKISTAIAPILEDSPPIFKVNFDQMPEATFVAKFDDNFGEEEPAPFVANFSQFEIATSTSMPPSVDEPPKPAAIPPADRYAVFREIIDQDLQQDSIEQKSSPEADDEAESLNGMNAETNILSQLSEDEKSPKAVPMPKIDTKITEAISHAKDRYAALRDIIQVEDLFKKPPQRNDNFVQDFPEFSDDFNSNAEDAAPEEDQKSAIESSPESNQNEEEDDQPESKKGSNKFLNILTVKSTTKDDLEIDELMNRAISNLSLDSREHLSPNNAATKSPATMDNNGESPHIIRKSPLVLMSVNASTSAGKSSQFNDMSTSPIPLQKSPAPIQKSPLSKSPLSKSPIPPQLVAVSNLIDASKRLNSGSLSDVVCGSSPDADTGLSDAAAMKPITGGKSPKSPKESWAVFEKNADMDGGKHRLKSQKGGLGDKDQGESPCSSDGKEDWNRPGGEEYNKRWPKGQTSSSSRDLSPWDDETSDYKKRIPPAMVTGADRHGYYMRHARRMNSCDEDYDYEEGISKRRDRKTKTGISRSRENFEFDTPQWYHIGPHHTWSPQDEEGRARSFDRGVYERTTYGPPVYDKREHKIPSSHTTYDRRDYKGGYDKRKFYREYMHSNYDFESYGESPDTKDRKMQQYYGDGSFEKMKSNRRDYENVYDESFGGGGGPRSYKSRDYIYERDRKSFDRDSIESYESASRRRRSFGSGDVYGSLESREEFRERYMGGPEKTRSLRKGVKMRLPTGGGGDDYDQDSEAEAQGRRVGPLDTRSLQRPSQGPQRMRKSSGSSPWDGEEHPPPGHGQKGWKRPSSASESERRLAESRRALGNTPSGSDGEKDRRFKRKPRSRGGKDLPSNDSRQPQRYGSHRDNYDYITYDDYDQPPPPLDEDKFERLNRRRYEMHQRMMESDRRQKMPVSEKYSYDDEDETPRYLAKKEAGFYSEKMISTPQHKHEVFDEPAVSKSMKHPRGADFDFDDFEDTPRSNTSSKFNFEEHGFESDFNSPPPASCNSASTTTPATKSSFRFSNDFSEKEKQITGSLHSVTTFDSEFSPAPSGTSTTNNNTATTITQKLRFDDRVMVSKFDNDQPSIGSSAACCDDAFEDDFSKADFDFEKEDQWNPEPPKKNNLRLNSKLQQRQEMIKKSESINIFAKKNEDPFEDDEFFKSPPPDTINDGAPSKSVNGNTIGKSNSGSAGNGSNAGVGGGGGGSKDSSGFQWENNFAKFDDNM